MAVKNVSGAYQRVLKGSICVAAEIARVQGNFP